jgi:hypothetical protein
MAENKDNNLELKIDFLKALQLLEAFIEGIRSKEALTAETKILLQKYPSKLIVTQTNET